VVILACALAVACREPVRVVEDPLLLGRQAVVLRPEGKVHIFDREHPPRIGRCVECDEPRFELTRSSVRALELEGLVELCGTVKTTDGGGRVFRWPACWARSHRMISEFEQRPSSVPEKYWSLWSSHYRALARTRTRQDPVRAWAESSSVALGLEVDSEWVRREFNAAFFEISSGRIEEAEGRIEGLAERVSTLDDPASDWLDVYSRGLLERASGDLPAAVARFREAVERARDLGESTKLKNSLTYLAALLSQSGMSAEALEVLESIRAEASSSTSDECAALVNEAFILLRIDDNGLERAGALFEKALQAARRSELRYWEALSLSGLLTVASMEGRLEEAEARWERFEQVADAARPEDLIQAELAMASVLLEHDETSDAQRLLRRGMDRAAKSSPADGASAVLTLGRAKLHAKLGATDVATLLFDEAMRLRAQAAARQALVASDEVFAFSLRDISVEAVEHALSIDAPARAFALAGEELALTLRALESNIRRSRLSVEDEQALTSLIGAYRRARRAEEAAAADDSLEAIRARAQAAKEPYEDSPSAAKFRAVQDFLQAKVPLEPARSVTATQAQAMLAPGEALLLTARGRRERWHAFFVNGEGLSVATASSAEGLMGFVGPRVQGVGHLYVVPGEWTTARRLHTLRLPGGALPYSALSVSYLPHPGFLAEGSAEASGPALAVLDSQDNLPATRREALALEQAADSVRVLMGGAATQDAVLDAMNGAGHFHFAGHATFVGSPWEHRLELAGGQSLSLRDLLVERPRLRSVVLNGCETSAHGAMGRRKELGLAEGFLAIGASSVVASDERISDQEAAAFMRRFYRLGGLNQPIVALRRASLEASATGSEVWKAYRALGRLRRPLGGS